MAQRRFGPVLAPGVVTIEEDAGKQVQPAPLGGVGYVGILEKGDLGKLITCSSAREFKKRCGGRIAESLLPDAVQDFFQHGDGRGAVHLIRVTDGNEQPASLTLYSREITSTAGTRVQAVMRIDAKNGGRWGGRTRVLASRLNVLGDVTATTLTVPATIPLTTAARKDEWKGGYVRLDQVSTKRYLIIGNTAGTTPVITVTADSDMLSDLGGSLTDPGFALELPRASAKELSVVVGDGQADAATLFSLRVLVDGQPALYYPNLSMDPASKYYFKNVINDDGANDEIVVTDLNGGNTDPKRRPASDYGLIAAVTATTLQAKVHQSYKTGTGTYAVALGTLTAEMKYRARIRCVVLAGATTMDVYASFHGFTEQKIGAAKTLSSQFADCPLLPPFTITPTSAAEGDELVIEYFPWEANALVGGYAYPDYANYPAERYRITGNTVDTISVAVGDLSNHGTTNDSFLVERAVPFANGYDGIAEIADADYYTVPFDAELSPFNDLETMNQGLVKLAVPGVTAAAVQKAGLAFAELKGHQFRVEIPPTTVTEADAIAWVNSTIGRNDMGVTAFPSYGWVDDPDRSGQLKRVSLTGAIHGREALVANNYGGYHKVAAGVGVTLARVLRLDVERPNGEMLEPQGLTVIRKMSGNFVIWGGGTIALDSAWADKNHREQVSHYGHVLRSNFDWAVFENNNPTLWAKLQAAVTQYFLTEYGKEALDGATFDEACTIKVDAENNTEATKAAGDVNVEIALRLPKMVRRVVFHLSKAGLFEQVA